MNFVLNELSVHLNAAPLLMLVYFSSCFVVHFNIYYENDLLI